MVRVEACGSSKTSTPGSLCVVDCEPGFAQIQRQLPNDLTEARVLDLGCNAGGIAVQFAQGGATVVGVEAGVKYVEQAKWVRERLALDIEYRNMSVYDIGRLDGTFDIVIFLGLFYHLRYPQMALDLLATKCVGTLIMNTPILVTDDQVMELRLPGGQGRITQPDEPRFNWWFPSSSALVSMLQTAGFSDIREFERRETPFVSSSPHANNESAFPTGATYLRASADAEGSVPLAMTQS